MGEPAYPIMTSFECILRTPRTAELGEFEVAGTAVDALCLLVKAVAIAIGRLAEARRGWMRARRKTKENSLAVGNRLCLSRRRKSVLSTSGWQIGLFVGWYRVI